MVMLHWAWLFAAFVIGTWMGAFLMALIKAKNPDFHDADDIQSGDVIVRDPEDPRRMSRITMDGKMYMSIDGGHSWRLYAYLPELEHREKEGGDEA